jgi:hypothetical protein
MVCMQREGGWAGGLASWGRESPLHRSPLVLVVAALLCGRTRFFVGLPFRIILTRVF